MNAPDAPRLHDLEPEDLDGHTIEELSDYLDAGRHPTNPSIEESAGCRIALEALERLRALTPELIAADVAAEPAADEGWVRGILAGIALDARAGRRVPISHAAPNADLGITEGAIRGFIRGAENAVAGVVIGRCRLQGDLTTPGAPIRVDVDASVPYGQPIPDLVERLREEIAARLAAHTELVIEGIDITVHDVWQLPTRSQEER